MPVAAVRPPRRLRARAALVAVLALVLVAGACSARSTSPWQTRLGVDHLLTGRIWDVKARRFIEPPALIDDLAAARFVLLGEKHDNPDDHRLQAWILRQLIAHGRRPAVAFEMFDADQAPAIARQLAAAPTDAGGLARAVDWAHSGWPDWAMYQPIAEAALAARLPVVAANLSQATARLLARKGVGALDPPAVAGLGLDSPLAADVHRAMADEIKESHCGMAPAGMVEPMIAVQRARDAAMAASLAAAATRDGAVLIAGFGHVRNDRGVPVALAARVPGAQIATVAFLEVSDDKRAPEDYAKLFGEDGVPVDFVWFTPRVDDEDPCQKFHEDLERARQKKKT